VVGFRPDGRPLWVIEEDTGEELSVVDMVRTIQAARRIIDEDTKRPTMEIS
jgi:hypothetical protein